MEEKDLIIDDLLKKVEDQKKSIGSVKRFELKTNMSICFDPIKNTTNVYNIHVQDENNLILFLTKIEDLIMSIKLTCEKYPILYNDFTLYGFSLEDWRDDIWHTLESKQARRKLKDLKVVEDRLKNLMSQDKKELIEIMAIRKLLGYN